MKKAFNFGLGILDLEFWTCNFGLGNLDLEFFSKANQMETLRITRVSGFGVIITSG